ncbi:MAG TPA: cytidylate kinase-like family protein [Gaiellaceae bacterium]|jgi:cytidylate kinase|nr:cytidylate kinase-like family protein [Gaiellaceae bacterium]
MPRSVISISYADGAGGPEIAKLVAERLGFKYADGGIIVAAAQNEKMFPEALSLAESRHAGRRIEVDFNRSESTESLRALIREAVVAAADEGDVVISAHAASFALTGRDDVLRVLVTASDDTRLRRFTEQDGADAKTASKRLNESDKGRAAYLKRFYGISNEVPTHYDLMINTDSLSSDEAVDVIVGAAK